MQISRFAVLQSQDVEDSDQGLPFVTRMCF